MDSARPVKTGDEERAYRKIRRVALGTALLSPRQNTLVKA